MIITELEIAKNLLLNDDVVAIPTETVYGLAANAFSEKAIKKIFEVKKRPYFNPLIVHIKSKSFLSKIAQNIPDKAHLLADAFWPGPLTLVLEKNSKISNLVTAGKDTVGVRVPNHALALELLNSIDFPLAAPSANTFKSLSPTCAAHVEKDLGKLVAILDGGQCASGIESTIIGFKNGEPTIFRLGAISVEDIEKVVGKLKIYNIDDETPVAPGMLSKHYAPKTLLIVSTNISQSISMHQGRKIGILQFKQSKIDQQSDYQIEILSATGNMAEAANNFFGALHRLDQQHLDIIIAEKMPNEGLGKAINDRLKRAISFL